MAGVRSLVLIIFLVLSATFVANTEGRKLLMSDTTTSTMTTTPEGTKKTTISSSFADLFLNALPKGTVPSSTPSKKTHATLDNEELFKRHLASIDRILRSVPSPGAGH
ncbi:hypothetical protein Tsubulata_017577 [Turnera subulata]|uniref:Uncharacterized protein n=1 Tax=Turnera subulata TaxID=218843 RepID=A0A9Q0G7P2_9ROSI|nr:hypothetical protein Tsubulata_017577 [Turnera subulata]